MKNQYSFVCTLKNESTGPPALNATAFLQSRIQVPNLTYCMYENFLAEQMLRAVSVTAPSRYGTGHAAGNRHRRPEHLVSQPGCPRLQLLRFCH